MILIATADTVIYDEPNSTTIIGGLFEGQQVEGDIIRFGAWVQLRTGGYTLKRYLRQPRVVTATDAEADATFDTLMTEKASLFNTLSTD